MYYMNFDIIIIYVYTCVLTEAQNIYKESLKFNINCHQTNNTLIKQSFLP